jgi:transglutaminase-like putative cysteine protease
VVPAAAVVGGILVAPYAKGGTANLPSLIREALTNGGLRQPPIPFDPGWRFLVLVLFAILVSAASAAAVSTAKPRLAVLFPIPITIGAGLLHPAGSELLNSSIGIVLLIAALVIAYGAELSAEGATTGRFELRRMLRAASLLVVIVVVLTAVARAGFLFPETKKTDVIPAQKPPPPPPEPDRVLFRVTSDYPGPWRVGVLDGYAENGLLLPPVDPRAVKVVPKSGRIATTARPTYTASFVIGDVRGHTLPTPAEPLAITGTARAVEFTPRTSVFRLRDSRVPPGFTYTVEAPVPPDAKALSTAPKPNADVVKLFTALPPPPPGVRALLASAPTDNSFDRLQYVRQALYEHVIASGAGKPVDIPPSRVDAMIAGAEATPYEINAAEVMLARWAGVPARLGFGFYGGDKSEGEKAVVYRPRHGAAWLEAYFEGYGFVPILGTPAKAKSSLSKQKKNEDPKIVPSDELALTVYVPVRLTSYALLYQIIRYWVLVALPFLIGLFLLWTSVPLVAKLLRAVRRRRWAAGHPARRVAVAYCEFRDRLYDLNIGDVRDTPLRFVRAIEADEEHQEFSWLVTRALWGDLARDLRIEDVEAAEDLGRSVTRRVVTEQTALNRMLGMISRASLRDPYSDEVPNLWPRRRRIVRAALTRGRSSIVGLIRRRRRSVPATAALLLLLLLAGAALPGCASQSGRPKASPGYPDKTVPDGLLRYTFAREAKVEDRFRKPRSVALVSEGRVWTIHEGDVIQGSVQISLFKPTVDGQDASVEHQVERGVAGSDFTTVHAGLARLRVVDLPEQRMFVWFPPDRNAMVLVVTRKKFTEADRLVRALLAYQRSIVLTPEASAVPLTPFTAVVRRDDSQAPGPATTTTAPSPSSSPGGSG